MYVTCATIKEKKFSKVMKNLTIFVDEYNENGILKGIYIKEKFPNIEINNDESIYTKGLIYPYG